MKRIRLLLFVGMVMSGILLNVGRVKAETVYDSPYVTFSPDGLAWTTDAGNQNVCWYQEGGRDDVITGVEKTIGEPENGWHYYAVKRSGKIPVARWQVELSRVNCCHTIYPDTPYYHGISYTRQPCFKPHFSGMFPICADCGQPVVRCYFYMSKEAAATLHYLDVGTNKFYYYLCPFNNNLEQGTHLAIHNCRSLSANRYRVYYNGNPGEDKVTGYMAPSYHMYGNEKVYEGNAVTPNRHLTRNAYSRIGWEFVAWNTMPDGSGQTYEDGAEILNLCSGDYHQDKERGSITLYAMWKLSESVLEIDPSGGLFDGNSGITEWEGRYGDTVYVDPEMVTPPQGYLVTFETGEGADISPIRGEQTFVKWSGQEPFWGEINRGYYTYGGKDGTRDRICAVYTRQPITLPQPHRENYSFGGWYLDEEYRNPAGDAGDSYLPTRDVTLYAQWVTLTLQSKVNFSADISGAVDLSWQQPDEREKIYKLYQCAAGRQWNQIYTATDLRNSYAYKKEYRVNDSVQTFVAPCAGFYRISAYGAQGGSYGSYDGGQGGYAEGSFWLDKGQKLNLLVGSSNGIGYGGEGTVYGHGGGCSMVSTISENGDEVLLLVAGGGGGASAGGDGGEGGDTSGLLADGYAGESGECGGGGGYFGGKSGEAKLHYHVEGVCNHVHIGTPDVKGGCYTLAVKCGEKLTHVFSGTKHWYWGGSDESYCPNCGADASKGETCTGHDTDYYRHDCPIHGKVKENTSESSPSVCSKIGRYDPDCGLTEDYFCGYPYDGYPMYMKPAYGGSSYVNEDAARSYRFMQGMREGDGTIVIVAEEVGFQDCNLLEGVRAFDWAPPAGVDEDEICITPVSATSVSVTWPQAIDYGTVYYHKAESYERKSGEMISVSNVTANTMVSGVRGYRILIDSYPDTEVYGSTGAFQKNNFCYISLQAYNQYLHIRTQDNAGNFSKTVHIPLGNLKEGNSSVLWPVSTQPLNLIYGNNACSAKESKTFYVRADGKTEFSIRYSANVDGIATDQYQVNHAILEVRTEERKTEEDQTEENKTSGERTREQITVPSCPISDKVIRFEADGLYVSADGAGYLQAGNHTIAERSNRGKRLYLERSYTLEREAHNQMLEIIPIAGADAFEDIVYSDYEKDVRNGIRIIGDGEAPIMEGLSVLENLPLIDRREQEIALCVSAYDDVSGVRDFYIEIENQDNGAKRVYRPNPEGKISIDICEDEPLFSGDFVVCAYAVDCVGNERSYTYGTTEFDLRVNLARTLAPHEPVFRKGESGVLSVRCWGYPEKIEIVFPSEMTEQDEALNYVYEYPLKGSYVQSEEYEFMIPLECPERDVYEITVRAYKGDSMIERKPALAVLGVKGSVLDDLRTRLR